MSSEIGETATVAERVIERCGGAKEIAAWLGIHETIVYKWTYDRGQAGAGLVPAKYQSPLLIAARERGINLRPEHFFEEVFHGAGE